MTIVPPIKSQGIKTKLVDWINDTVKRTRYERWIEPFCGTGVVAFNLQPISALLCDSNPHLIHFYQALQKDEITSDKVRHYLIKEGTLLLETQGDHYYVVRERFNKSGNPLDFMFLSRSCFNGMMRFNKSGGFNVPFCRKPNRFAQQLITKICNQIDAVSYVMKIRDFTFKHQEFDKTIDEANTKDMIYCDPPYIGRHVDYFDSWSEDQEKLLNEKLNASQAKFIASTWLQNKYRMNDYIFSVWNECFIVTKEHFYYVGAKENNRGSVTEALLTNFSTLHSKKVKGLDTL